MHVPAARRVRRARAGDGSREASLRSHGHARVVAPATAGELEAALAGARPGDLIRVTGTLSGRIASCSSTAVASWLARNVRATSGSRIVQLLDG